MNKFLLGALAASVLVGGFASAMTAEEIQVSAARSVPKVVGRDANGSTIIDITLSYGVSYAGLDLASATGAAELQKRVADASKTACEELARQHPLANFQTDTAECTKSTIAKAMVQVKELVAAASSKKAGK
jgi:UrcA family protein